MRKRVLTLLFGCILLPCLPVFFLQYKSNGKLPSFERTIRPNTISLQQVKQIPSSYKSLAGMQNDTLYVETSRPGLVMKYNSQLLAIGKIDLRLDPDRKLASRYYTTVNYPNLYIYGGNLGKMVIGNIIDQRSTITSTHTRPFSRALAIGSSTHIFRGFVQKDKPSQYFVKLNTRSDRVMTVKQIINNQNDYGLSEDGILQYDAQNKTIIYTYFYSSDVLVLDTGLHAIRHFHTIDKTEKPTINRKFIDKGSVQKYTNSSPKRVINYQTAVHNNKLYVMSWAQSKSQSRGDFAKNACIDIYDVKDGFYISSFYIPFVEKDKPKKFIIQGDKLLVLYNNHLASYRIHHE